jgi:DNA-directed RNA polymerase subunit RPC12/RpoP
MVQFCPKCGTKASDDESAFCNKCGTRLPPVIPEKMDIICPRCGTKFLDEQSVFCNKCGSQLQRISPVQIPQTRTRPAAALPAMKKKSCPSCGAPLVDEISDYCNVCGATIHEPAPLTPARETFQPFPEKMGPVTPVADIPYDGEDVPVQEKSRRPFLKWGLVAVVAIIFLVVAAAFIPGMISGTNQSVTTPAPDDQNPQTTLPTQKTTQTTAPKLTTAPAIITTTPVPATVVTTNASTTMTTNASATVTTNTSANVTANASTIVKPTPSPTFPTQPLSIGQSASDGKGKLTVNSITFKDKLSDPIPSYAIGKKYLIVEITYENLQQNITADPDINGMVVKDGGGYTFDQATDILLENPFYVIGKSIPPQENRTGNMLFIVPQGATFLKLQYNFGTNIATFQLT